jgi:hypothetical protein
MSEGLERFKRADNEATAFYADKSTTDQWKYEHTALIADRLMSEEEKLQGQLAKTWAKAVEELDDAKKENSVGRLGDNDYQRRIMEEVDLIRHLPDDVTQEDIQARINVFWGDELARSVLVAVLKETSEYRKNRDVMGFDTSVMLPDVYGLQRAMLDKIFTAIDKKLFDLGANFTSRLADSIARDNNKKVVLIAEGVFTGVAEYTDILPVSVLRPEASRAMTGVNFRDIPCYANTGEDLNMYFSMYRKPKQ